MGRIGQKMVSAVLCIVTAGLLVGSISPIVQPAPVGAEEVDGTATPLLESEERATDIPDLPAAGTGPTASQPRPAVERGEELVHLRTAHRKVFEGQHGVRIVDVSDIPVHHQVDDDTYREIDARFRETPGGDLVTRSNDWTVTLGTDGAGPTVSSDVGDVTFTPLVSDQGSAAAVDPTGRDGRSRDKTSGEATYEAVWNATDLEYTVTGAGLKEDIVLHDSTAPSSFTFAVEGATVIETEDGWGFSGSFGRSFALPPPVVIDATGADVSSAARAAYEVAEEGGRQTLTVRVDPAWLAGLPAASFPVRLDPAVDTITPDAAVIGSSNGSTYAGPATVQVGRTTGGVTWRGAVHFDEYETSIPGDWRVYWATLHLNRYLSGSHGGATTLSVYDQGAQPTTYGAIGSGVPLIASGTEGAVVNGEPTSTRAFDVTETMDGWLTGGHHDRWFGIRGQEGSGTRTDKQYFVRLSYAIYEPPPASEIERTADESRFPTTTPTLEAAEVVQSEGQDVAYEFQVTTGGAPGEGQIVSSGKLEEPVWSVPDGYLREGPTYHAWVFTSVEGPWPVPPSPPDPEDLHRFTIDLGLGAGAPSPIDEVGSAPGMAESGSQGAGPHPALPQIPLRVNMINGNVSTSISSRSVEALAGLVDVSLQYNSRGPSNAGLRAEYFEDTDGDEVIDSGDRRVADRVDAAISFDWGNESPVGALPYDAALARWTGELTLPASGTWEIGAVSSDGIKVWLEDDVVLDRTAPHSPEPAPVYGTQVEATAGEPQTLKVEWSNDGGAGVARLFARHVDGVGVPSYAIPGSWLSRSPVAVPAGWNLTAAAASSPWVGLQDDGTSVLASSSQGAVVEFRALGDGSYQAEPPYDRHLLTAADDGGFTLHTDDGVIHTFDPSGNLASTAVPSGDVDAAALVLTYDGSPALLRTIEDPVSERETHIRYGGDGACPSGTNAPLGMLCAVEAWDGTSTTYTYDGQDQLVRITHPGPIATDLAYDENGRLAEIRDALANEAVAAGIRADSPAVRTSITYDGSGRVWKVTQPAPIGGAARPQRTYTYDAGSRLSEVDHAGVAPTVGYMKQVRYDARGRIVEDSDSFGATTTFVWRDDDQVASATGSDGLVLRHAYDPRGRRTATYGPAPAGEFGVDGRPLPTSDMPRETVAYDEGLRGLSAYLWEDAGLRGPPARHETLGSSGLDLSWSAGQPLGSSDLGVRLEGLIDIPNTLGYEWQLASKGSDARLWIDGVLVADQTAAEPSSGWAVTAGAHITTLTAGTHRIRVDMSDLGGASGVRVDWLPDTGSVFEPVAGANLLPDHGVTTSTTDGDGVVTAYEYTGSGLGPQDGLVTATVQDPGGEALRTAYAYETPGTGYHRRISRTMPSGSTWSYAHYGGTEGPISAVCGISTGTPQAGMPKQVTGPDPDGIGPGVARVEQYAYDAAGRRVATRVGSTTTIAGAGWSCVAFGVKGRPTTEVVAAHGSAAGRTRSFAYGVGGNPLTTRLTDTEFSGSAIETTVDLLGRVVRYTDIWGAVTTTTYDQAGRVTETDGPAGAKEILYDTASGHPEAQLLDGRTMAQTAYDPHGRIDTVEYANGSVTESGHDPYGRIESATTRTGSTVVAAHEVTRSSGARIVDERVLTSGGMVDATPSSGAASFDYDGAGRLIAAVQPEATYTYDFGPSGCGATSAGESTNRTSSETVVGGVAYATSYCYDAADRLTRRSGVGAGTVEYDDRGNTTRLGATTYQWDASDRLTRTETPTEVVRIRRDPADRVVQRRHHAKVQPVATSSAAVTSNDHINVPRPTGTAEGDLVVVSAVIDANGTLDGTGWSLVGSATAGTSTTVVLFRRVEASPPSAWTLDADGTATSIVVAAATYRNVQAPTAVDGTPTTATTSSGTTHPISFSPTTGDARQLVIAMGASGGGAAAAPSGFAERVEAAGSGRLATLSDRLVSFAGTPTGASSTTSSSTGSATVAFALVPTTQTTRTGYEGNGSVATHVTDATGNLIERTMGLAGGMWFRDGDAGESWGVVNLRDQLTTLLDENGVRTSLVEYGPYGERPAGSEHPDAVGTRTAHGAFGGLGRTTDGDHVEMGARIMVPELGRFLTVDPVEGGCANDYVYVSGDPLSSSDASGRVEKTLNCGTIFLDIHEDRVTFGFRDLESQAIAVTWVFTLIDLDLTDGTAFVLSDWDITTLAFRDSWQTSIDGLHLLEDGGGGGDGPGLPQITFIAVAISTLSFTGDVCAGFIAIPIIAM